MAGPKHSDKYRTRWAAQFYAAAEPTRRDYVVAPTLGNAPASDLLPIRPRGWQFALHVEGLAMLPDGSDVRPIRGIGVPVRWRFSRLWVGWW